MIIKKKVKQQFFEEILNGTKKFEIRLADFEINPGDILILKEVDNETGSKPTGRMLEKQVKVVRKTKDVTHWPKNEIEKYGLQVIGF